jgi:hypothetical protein
MTAAVLIWHGSSSATIVLLVGDAQDVLRSMAGRVVVWPDGRIGRIAGTAGGVTGYFAQPIDYRLPGFPLGAKAHTGIIRIEGEAP